MSYELVNQSTEIFRRFSRPSWHKMLELARRYGWKPMGTTPPYFFNGYELDAEWSGTYLTNDGQAVKAEDARALAAALEKSLADIPDAHTPIDWNSVLRMEDDLPEWLSPEERTIIEEALYDGLLDTLGAHPFDFFSGKEKRRLADFIRFCRLGSFEIL